MTRSPWFPNVTSNNSNTSSPWFTETYRMTDKVVKKLKSNKVCGGKNDVDGDCVPNKKDCQPKNTMRQDSVATIAQQGLGNLLFKLEPNKKKEKKFTL